MNRIAKILIGSAALAIAGCASAVETASTENAVPAELPLGLEAFQTTEETTTCVSVSRIRNTRVIDDSNVLFVMTNRKTYLNRLLNRCSGLNFRKGFGYKLSGTQLCRGQIIKVLESFGGGASCALGTFELLEDRPE